MLFEIAIGDAYGAGFEYAGIEKIRQYNNLSKYHAHESGLITPGCYTDDTQMSLAIAELMLEGLPWHSINIAEKFVEVFKRDPRYGYARHFYRFLELVDDGKAFLKAIRPNSDKSGAAMRASPIGLYPDIATVIDYSTKQANLTHNTPLGRKAAIAVALSSHYFVHEKGVKSHLPDFLIEYLESDWRSPWNGPVGSLGIQAVKAALFAVYESESLSQLLIRCIDFGGDVDTVAAIAMGIASHCREIENDLPVVLINELEAGPFGKDYLLDIDSKLKEKYAMSL